jgi:hypothetical protein
LKLSPVKNLLRITTMIKRDYYLIMETHNAIAPGREIFTEKAG